MKLGRSIRGRARLYFYTSRLRGEPNEGVDDIHTHPNDPRAVRFTVTAKF